MADKILITSDHAGFGLKSTIVSALRARGNEVIDLGPDGVSPIDYPDMADKLAIAMGNGEAPIGILICSTGIGISIAANRYRHVRAALCHDITTARMCRLHNDANVLVLGASVVGQAVALDCVETFLSTKFEGGRHARRVSKLGERNA